MKEEQIKLTISNLPHTWFIDLDGTIFKHNHYKKYEKDIFCNSNVKKFFHNLPSDDYIVFTTSRSKEFSALCEESIEKLLIIRQKYTVIYDLPHGERILLNDKKPSGLITAISIPIERDQFPLIKIDIDNQI